MVTKDKELRKLLIDLGIISESIYPEGLERPSSLNLVSKISDVSQAQNQNYFDLLERINMLAYVLGYEFGPGPILRKRNLDDGYKFSGQLFPKDTGTTL